MAESAAAPAAPAAPAAAPPEELRTALRAELREELRGQFYGALDLLAFALEMECGSQAAGGDDDAAARTQQTRLGVRLAQRLVSGVPTPEVDRRLQRWRDEYHARFPA
jgi:hypothetical protein